VEEFKVDLKEVKRPIEPTLYAHNNMEPQGLCIEVCSQNLGLNSSQYGVLGTLCCLSCNK